jgi:hypothetical protein
VVIFAIYDFIPLTAHLTTSNKDLGRRLALFGIAFTDSASVPIFKRFGQVPALFLFLFLGASLYGHFLGGVKAQYKTYFLLVKGEPYTVVLAQYDTIFITQRYCPTSKKLFGYLKVSKLEVIKGGIELALAKIGPLKPFNLSEPINEHCPGG